MSHTHDLPKGTNKLSHQGTNQGWKSWCHGLGTTTCHKETSRGIPEPKEIAHKAARAASRFPNVMKCDEMWWKCDENVMKYVSISNLPSKLSSAGWWVHPRKPHCRVHRQQPPRVLESVANPKKVLSTTSFMAVTSFGKDSEQDWNAVFTKIPLVSLLGCSNL